MASENGILFILMIFMKWATRTGAVPGVGIKHASAYPPLVVSVGKKAGGPVYPGPPVASLVVGTHLVSVNRNRNWIAAVVNGAPQVVVTIQRSME